MLKTLLALFLLPAIALQGTAATLPPILFGAAYYEEYEPYDRLDADIKMMKAAGINVVRIAESTWSTLEPQDGMFDFSHIDRVLAGMNKAGISVIVGTPTYAIPTWLARKYPEVLVETPGGRRLYGPRQNMDITNPVFKRYAERVIRKLVEHVRDQPAVIGYQVDNETKSYQTSGAEVQKGFVEYVKRRFPDLKVLNQAWGLDYWSSRINTWEDFPNVNGAVNASITSSFAAYQRSLVTDYLAWQAKMVRELKRPDQFITHNFDLDWRGYSFGIQQDVDHFAAAKALDIAGIDIYHPTQDHLTGTEIALGGDLARSMLGGKNYLVIETEAQGFPEWTPYLGQLRLQAYSHLASGARMVSYWHWATTHNNVETYWRGLLSQDYEPNETYREAVQIGSEFARLGDELAGLEKSNQVAVYFSNNAQTAFNAFRFGWGSKLAYNDVFRPFYDALYRMNIEADLVDPSTKDLARYRMIVVPALYAASEAEITAFREYVRGGGHLVLSFKSGFSDENVKVRTGLQPGGLADIVGASYSQFVIPEGIKDARWWAELLKPAGAEVLEKYDHPVWGRYAALTRNRFGKGEVTYVGYMPSDAGIEKVLRDAAVRAGVTHPEAGYPLIIRSGVNSKGRSLHYFLNYSAVTQKVVNPFGARKDLLTGASIAAGQKLTVGAWGVIVLEE